jgi:1-aminocyclopropane-1-carboxylate deaminase
MAIDFDKYIKIPTHLVEIHEEIFENHEISVFVKRDDLCHKYVSGNKFRKLKYTLLEAKKTGQSKLLTFGGAYSNHIRAVAEAGNLFGFETEAFIRGEELKPNSNLTLSYAHEAGMKLHFVSRTAYQEKEKLAKPYLNSHIIIPEGGTMPTALPGIAELLDENPEHTFDFICTAMGTGGTMAGLLSNTNFKGQIIGFPAIKGADFLRGEIKILLPDYKQEIKLVQDYHFGGYGKHTSELIEFCKAFEAKHNIPLEQVYTGKMIYGFYDLVQKNFFKKGSKIMLLHTGGLQGRCF